MLCTAAATVVGPFAQYKFSVVFIEGRKKCCIEINSLEKLQITRYNLHVVPKRGIVFKADLG
jgi:hypothetical protein